MKNGTLVVNNSEELANDILQQLDNANIVYNDISLPVTETD